MFGFSISHSHLLLFTCVLVFFCSSYFECRTVPVRRVLPPRPGYIPVYIQHGDTPPDVAALYKSSSMSLHHKTASSKHPQKNKPVYQSGHYLYRSKGNQPEAPPTRAVLHHKMAAAADAKQYRTNVNIATHIQ